MYIYIYRKKEGPGAVLNFLHKMIITAAVAGIKIKKLSKLIVKIGIMH
jgi:hypothetical protein